MADKKIGIGLLLFALIFIVIGLALTPTVISSTVTAQATDNISTAVSALLDLVPLLYVILIIGGTIGFVVIATRQFAS